jgi:hypothetical protein
MAPLGSPLVQQKGWVCRLSLLPFCTAVVVGYVVSSTAAALNLLLWGSAPLCEVSVTTSNTPWHVTAVALRKAEALTVLPLSRAFWGDVRLNRDLQAAEFSQRTQFRQLWSLRYWHNKVWGYGGCPRRFPGHGTWSEALSEASQPTNQKANWGHPSICLAIPALLGSITDTLNYNWECTYANDYPSGLKNPMWANWGPLLEAIGLMRGHNFGWKVFWDSNLEWTRLNFTIDWSWKNLAALRGKSADRAPSSRVLPWHLPDNWGKKHG